MGGVVDAIFGGGDEQETTVTYDIPPEVRELQRIIAEEIKALRPLSERAIPDVQGALQEYLERYMEWFRQAPEIYDRALERQREMTEEAISKTKAEGERLRGEARRVSEDVLDTALRDTIRQLSASGLISQTAGTQAMSEQFRKYMLEPELNLLALEGKNIADIMKAMYLQQSGILGRRLGFDEALPQYLRDIATLKQQKALTPFELRRALLGTLSGVAPTMMQMAPANVTQATTGGVNPILGGLLGTAGSLGLFKLFGII